jgi:hypothetical protein
MADAGRPADRFDLGCVIQRTFGAIGHNLASFAILSLALSGAPALASATGLMGIMAGAFRTAGQGGFGWPLLPVGAGMALALGGALVSIFGNAILQGAVIFGTASYLAGRKAGLSECFAEGARRCLPLVGLLIVLGVAEVIGLMLFIVPGVMMFVAWIAAIPVLVFERTGIFAAIGRSAELTRGRRWAIFALVIIYLIVVSILQQVLVSLAGTLITIPTPQAVAVYTLPIGAVVNILVTVLASAGAASIYYELRVGREGIGPEALAAVFD